ncbi:g11274 [Coccomyxa elongata]
MPQLQRFIRSSEPSKTDSRHVVVPPLNAGRPATLLMLLPGAYMKPSDYTGVTTGLQNLLDGKVALWVAAAYPIWQEVDHKAPDAMQQATQRVTSVVDFLLGKAQQEGFPASKLLSGRVTNMVILAHSSAALFAAPLASRLAGSLVLLGSYLFPSSEYHASLREFSRPVMHLGGMLDGQARFSKMVYAAQDAAYFASQAGPKYAAAQKAVILLPGVNHASLSNGHVRSDANDLPPEASLEDANLLTARFISDFILVHCSTNEQEADEALIRLQEGCLVTARWLAPFTKALGRGSIDKLWMHGFPQHDSSGQKDWNMTCLLASARGAEIMPDTDTSRRYVAHPGEWAAAEDFCTHVQQRIVQQAEDEGHHTEEACMRVHVVSSVHTDVEAFIRSQPTLQLCRDESSSGAYLQLHAHCYLHRPNLVPFGHRFPVAPEYFLKLKSSDAVALVRYGPDCDATSAAPVSAFQINEETFQEALQRVNEQSRELFLRRGKQPLFMPDRDVSRDIATPVQWIKDIPLDFSDSGANATKVTSPVVKTAAVQSNGSPGPEAAFQGNLYMKTLSLAGAVEWIMCDGLRPSSHQPQ